MPRKIFLSFLGANNYVECNYFKEGKEDQAASKVENVMYVQEAVIPLFCQGFSTEDRYYFFLTQKARQVNWENDGLFNRETKKNDLPNKGLRQRLEEMNLPGQVEAVSIPEGFSTEEIWGIFEVVLSKIAEGDQVYFDITHAFRSLPLLGLAMLNYAKAVKKIEVKGIYYGAFEKLGRAEAVRRMDLKDRNAPILDLRSVSALQDWTTAAFDFIQYGRSKSWRKLTQTYIQPILKETRGEDEEASRLRAINSIVEKMEWALTTNRGQQLFEKIPFERLKELLHQAAGSGDFIKPLLAIIEKLEQKVEGFTDKDPLHWLKSAKWCAQHQMYQEGLTQLQEGILTWLCLRLQGEDAYYDWKKEDPRTLISAALNIITTEEPEEKWRLKGEEDIKRCRLLVKNALLTAVAPLYRNLTNLRNDINHGGYTKTTKPETFAKKLHEFINATEELIQNIPPTKPEDLRPKEAAPAKPAEEKPRGFLLNLSNHPSERWTEEQLKSAISEFGEVKDLAFPQIPPDYGESDISRLAGEYLTKVLELKPGAVHLMGEMTFTSCLVALLQKEGIPCLASTTRRVAIEEGNKKISVFQFIRFRRYPDLCF